MIVNSGAIEQIKLLLRQQVEPRSSTGGFADLVSLAVAIAGEPKGRSRPFEFGSDDVPLGHGHTTWNASLVDALGNLYFEWDVTGMTVVVDLKNCVQLPTAQPGDHFDLQVAGVGKFVHTRLDSDPNPPDNVRIERRGGFTVGVLDRSIDEQSLTEALSECP